MTVPPGYRRMKMKKIKKTNRFAGMLLGFLVASLILFSGCNADDDMLNKLRVEKDGDGTGTYREAAFLRLARNRGPEVRGQKIEIKLEKHFYA